MDDEVLPGRLTEERRSGSTGFTRESGLEAKGIGMERLLTVAQAAEYLETTQRFPRRLIAERRIRFVHVGRHVRIPESALVEFVDAGTVQPVAFRQRVGGVA